MEKTIVGLIFAVLLLSLVNTGTVLAEEPLPLPDEPQIPWRIEGNGTHFELNNSDYLNVTLDSSEHIYLFLESVPEIVTMYVESASGTSSTTITLSGFIPLTTYHKYEDDYHNHTAFTTDANGNYTYIQDLSEPHIVFIQPKASTNVVLDSSESINLVLESASEMVTMRIESASGASSTTITLSGFMPLTTYHKYEDDYHNHTAFTTDANGNYTYIQDLFKPHIVFIQPRPSTKFIQDNATGGDCTSIGVWDLTTKTCILKMDVYETIQIDSDGVTLDGSGHTITGSGTGYGIYLYGRTDVTIKNLNINNFNTGIYLGSSDNSVVINNTISINWVGIILFASNSNIISNNKAMSNSGGGIFLRGSNSNILSGNTANSNNMFGYNIDSSSDNTLLGNIAQYNLGSVGIIGHPGSAGGNSYGIYIISSANNTFVDNIVQYNTGGEGGRASQRNSGLGGVGGGGYGIYLSLAYNHIFTNNTVQNNNGGRGGSADIWNGGHSGTGGGGYGIYMNYSEHNYIIYNIIQNNNGGTGGYGNGVGGSGYGIYLSSSSTNEILNNTIQSNKGMDGSWVSRFRRYYGGAGGSSYGIYLDSSNSNKFEDNTIQNNNAGNGNLIAGGGSGHGIYLSYSDSNDITKNTAQNNNGGTGMTSGSNYSIYLSFSNLNNIYNNYFNSTNNFYIINSADVWNSSKKSNTNFVGGPYLGGNFWANPSGTGYSQTCTDADGDGICDSPYTLDGSNIDYLPLSMNFTLDAVPPTTTITLSGTLGNNGWYTSDVQATLNATDNEGGSGVKITEYSLDGINWVQYDVPFSVTNEGMTMVYFKSTDNAGNVESITNQTVKIDKTPPTITGAPTTSPNADGWYNTDVVVHFTASDAVSGIDTVTPDTTISSEGVNQSATGTAIDKAGNSASTTVSGINIDKTQPQVTINTPANSGVYILNQILIADWSATDMLSGIASAVGTLPNGAPIDTGIVGAKTFTVNAADNASNTATQTASYTITYDFLGILPPVRTDNSSIFKLGSTIPVKFRIADANGNYVSTAVANLTYQKITNDILGTIEEAISTSAASEGNAFRYDSTDDLYIFNLGTTGMDTGTYQLNINLDDGTVKTVRISLK
jgi:parallel beta-helix repeat protein